MNNTLFDFNQNTEIHDMNTNETLKVIAISILCFIGIF